MPSPIGRPWHTIRSSVSSSRADAGSWRRSPGSTRLYFLAFLALLGYAKDFMAKEVLGISLALWGGLSICALTVILAAAYARRAPEWERMAQRVVEEASR